MFQIQKDKFIRIISAFFSFTDFILFKNLEACILGLLDSCFSWQLFYSWIHSSDTPVTPTLLTFMFSQGRSGALTVCPLWQLVTFVPAKLGTHGLSGILPLSLLPLEVPAPFCTPQLGRNPASTSQLLHATPTKPSSPWMPAPQRYLQHNLQHWAAHKW